MTSQSSDPNDFDALRPLHEVITFYSYKGGTGRTMALANIACLFARQVTASMRILAIDWDLEAPGLHYYLRSPNSVVVDLNSKGVTEYFSQALELVEGAMHEDDEDAYAEQILAQIPFEKYCRKTEMENLDLMPAGFLDSTYQGRLAKMDWQRLYQKAPAIFRSFARQVARKYHVVLVDSRTGMTDISGICTALLPDKLVVIFTPNRQSLAGVEHLVLNSVKYRQESRDMRPLMIYPLPSRIDAEREKLQQLWRHGDQDRGVEGFQPQFERILSAAYALESCDLSNYFDQVKIQHSSDYSYGEEVATWKPPDADRFSIVQSYQALVNWLQSSAEPWESPERGALRKRLDTLLLKEAEVLREDPPTDVRGRIGLQEDIFRLAISLHGLHHLDTVSATERLIRSCLLQVTDLSRAVELCDQLARAFPQMYAPIRLKALGIILDGTSMLRAKGRTKDADHLLQLVTTFLPENSSEFDQNSVDFVEFLADKLYERHALVETHALRDLIVKQRRWLHGAKSLETLRSIEKLAETLRAQADLAGARRLQENVLEVRRSLLGEEHPDTLSSMKNLADTLSIQGDLNGARRLLEQVLETGRRMMAEEQPATSRMIENLSELNKNKKKIFLASSSELQDDRKAFEIFLNRKNKDWVKQGVFLELVLWEDFLDAMSKTRLQDEYNRAIRECDLFVLLFFTKVGKYTAEEFETAFGHFQATGKPFIFTYFKDAEISTGSADKKDLMSLWAFQEKLDALGHFYTRYQNIDQLQLHFSQQLDKLVASGFIEFKPDQEAAAPGTTTYQATLTGDGAIAQGPGARAVGAGGVVVGGNNIGRINTVLQTNIATQGGAVEAGGHFIGRDFIQIIARAVHVGEDPGEVRSVIAHYLDALATDLAGLKLSEIDVSAQETKRAPLRLADVYVPLDTQLPIPKDATLVRWLARDQRPERGDLAAQRETRPVSALEALAAHRELTVLGKPGSGKSTFGASVLLALAQTWQGHPAELARLGERWTHGAPFPSASSCGASPSSSRPATRRPGPAICGTLSPATWARAATACRPTRCGTFSASRATMAL
jgi:eukaryotic-like serine/threonine-protein kinase